MANRPYTDAEREALAEFVHRQVPCWPAVLERLPGRSHASAHGHLKRERRKHGTVWLIHTGRVPKAERASV